VLAPVTDRGDVIGVLEMLLPADPDEGTVDYIASAAHALGYVVIVNRRFTDLCSSGPAQSAGLPRRSDPTPLIAHVTDLRGGAVHGSWGGGGAGQHPLPLHWAREATMPRVD
jgi:hypothetical protein